MKICAISDVHEQWGKLIIPQCDLLISVGDYSYQGKPNVVKDFHEWLDKQPAKNIISVNGNHELWVQDNFQEAKEIAQTACPRVHFVEHEAINIDGLKIFASAWSPYFCAWAYNGARSKTEQDIYGVPLMKDLWAQIPEDTELLLTHTPVYQILDYAPQCGHVGDRDLFHRILELPKLKAHISGHIHFSHGMKEFNGVRYYNASICTEQYKPTNPITEFEL